MNDTIPALGQLIEPAPIQFSFGAPGWYILGGILLIVLCVGVFLSWKHYRKNHYRRMALQWLQQEEQRLIAAKEEAQLVYTANMLIKRIAMQLYGREIASLRGKDWLDFIKQTDRSVCFNDEDIELLDALYTSDGQINNDRAVSFVNKTKHWIKTHRHEP